MKPINEVYPEEAQEEKKRGACYGPSDYKPMLDSMGYETLLRVDDSDYKGDSRLILRDGSRYGVLIFGWGSCSGCDALQACHSMKEIDDLRTSLRDSVKWFESQAECLRYFETHDWEGDYGWHADETRQFVLEGKQLLTEAPNIPVTDAEGQIQLGLHCGVEDRACADRYQGANYGYACGVNRALEWAQNEAQAALANNRSSATPEKNV